MNARDTIVAIQACDGKGGITTQQFTLHVVHVNHPPRILSQAITNGQEDSMYVYHCIATDQDSALYGDRLSYSLTIHPFWMSIDSVKGIISGTPHAISIGDTVVAVQVSDGKGGTATQSYPLTVTHTNHAPVIRTTNLPSAVEDTLYQTRVYASDQDSALFGDVVHYRLTVRPVWLKIDSVSGIVMGTASGVNAQDTVVTVTAYDGKGGASSRSYAVHIVHTNHPPVIVSIAATHAAEDTLYRYAVWGSDPDSALWGDRVHYHLTIRPSWITIDSVSGAISGTPRCNQRWGYVVTVQGERWERRHSDTELSADNVSHTNHAPVIKTVSLPSVIEDSLYQTRVYASDQDSALFGDVVHYRLLKPAWLVIDSTAGVISGTPHVQNVFDTIAVLQAYDNHGATTQQQYTIHITLVNHPPAIASSPVLTAHEDTLYQYQFVAHDPDTLIGQILSYALTQKPIWLSISASGMSLRNTARSERRRFNSHDNGQRWARRNSNAELFADSNAYESCSGDKDNKPSFGNRRHAVSIESLCERSGQCAVRRRCPLPASQTGMARY